MAADGVVNHERVTGHRRRPCTSKACAVLEDLISQDFPDQEFSEPLQFPLKRKQKEEKPNDVTFRFSCIMADATLAQVLSATTECWIINEIKSKKTRMITKQDKQIQNQSCKWTLDKKEIHDFYQMLSTVTNMSGNNVFTV